MKQQRIYWIVFMLLICRTLLAVAAQGAVTLGVAATGEELSFLEAGRWWTVYGSMIDLGTLALLVWALRKEGTNLTALIGFSAAKLKNDVKHAGLLFLAILPLTFVWGMISSYLIYGQPNTQMVAGPLPVWGVWYSILAWPIGWAIMEQAVYMGYVLPRLERTYKNRATAVAIVMFFWALQHIALPVTSDLDYMLYRYLTVVPMVIIPIYYLRTRRLVPLIMIHIVFDSFSAVSFYLLLP